VGLLLPRRARVSATEATSLLRLPGRSTAGTNEQTLHDLSHEAAAGLLREGQPPLSVREQNPEGVSIAYVPGLPVHSDPGVRDEEETAMSLEIQPIEFDEACAFVRQHHRHHIPPPAHKFCLAVNDGEKVVGVAIVNRPVARMADNGWTLEVSRCCTDGTKNACSALYSACWRAARAMGYQKLITYTLPEEGGASLKAANWKCVGKAGGGSWSRPSRPRVDKHPLQTKLRWEVEV